VGVLKIVEWPSKVLETKAEEITLFDESVKKLVLDMHETMKHENGIGLAANQVNVLKRVFVVNIPWVEKDGGEEKQDWHDKAFTFINPVITKISNEKVSYQEGCLSFPEVYDFVGRHERVTVEAFNEKGESFSLEASGLLSICIQHELDHIDGIVFIKRMSRLKAKLARSKINKYHLRHKTNV